MTTWKKHESVRNLTLTLLAGWCLVGLTACEPQSKSDAATETQATNEKQPQATYDAKPDEDAGSAANAMKDMANHAGDQATKMADHAKAGMQAAADKAKAAAAEMADSLSLTGLSFDVPAGWTRQATGGGPMAAVAVYSLPKAEGDEDDAELRITHYPKMKGMDAMNIKRWVGMVHKPDGTAFTPAEVAPVITDLKNVRLTVVDLSGAIQSGGMMRGPVVSKPNSRLIAAIVDHPQGPHFVKITGPQKTVEKWADAIDAFLKSAKMRK